MTYRTTRCSNQPSCSTEPSHLEREAPALRAHRNSLANPVRLHREMLQRIQHLPYPALVLLVRQLLQRMGYQHVQLKRTHFRGRNSGGGCDLEAVQENELTCQRLLVQVKQLVQPVQGRYVDELRGVLLREGATQGLLITTGTFSPVAREAAETGQAVAHVLLVDGQQLTQLLVAHRVGLLDEEDPERATAGQTMRVDTALFERLQRMNTVQHMAPPPPPTPPTKPGTQAPQSPYQPFLTLCLTLRRHGKPAAAQNPPQ